MLAVTVLGLVLGLWGGSGPAAADGLDFGCATLAGAPAPPTSPAEISEAFKGVALTFDGTAPDGTTLHKDLPVKLGGFDLLTGAPVTGGVMQGVDLNGDGTADVLFGFALRASTAPPVDGSGSGANPLQRLFGENYTQVPDYGLAKTAIAGIGLELRVVLPEGSALPTTFGGRYKGEFGIRLDYTRKAPDGTPLPPTSTLVRVGVDALKAGARWPNEDHVGLLYREASGLPAGTHLWGFAHETEYTGTSPRPPLGLTLDVRKVETAAPDRRDVAVALDWDAVPRDFAAGTRDLCLPVPGFRSTSHLAWVRPDPGAVATGVDVDVRTGLGLGLGGADEFSLQGRVSAVPERLDWILHPDSMSVTRSAETVPDVRLDRLQLATDDPVVGDDRPTYASGAVDALPRHFRMEARHDPATGELLVAEMSFWDLACPGVGPPEDAIPLYPAGCTRTIKAAASRVAVRLQDHLPADPLALLATTDFPGPPADPARPYVLYASRAPRPVDGEPLGYYRIGGLAHDVASFSWDTSLSIAGGDGISLEAEKAGAETAGADVLVHLDGRDRADEVANTGTYVDVRGPVKPLPERLSLGYASWMDATGPVETAVPVAAQWAASEAVAVGAPGAPVRLQVRLKGPDAVVADGELDLGGLGAAPLPDKVQLMLKRSQLSGGLESDSELLYEASAGAHLRVGGIVTNRRERVEFRRRTRVHADLDVPRRLRVAWKERLTQDRLPKLVSADASMCPSPVGCPANALDVMVESGPPRSDDASLIAPPALPEVPADVRDAFPGFSGLGDEGVRAVFTKARAGGADEWAAVLRLRNLVSAHYEAEVAQLLSVQTREEGKTNPFSVTAYDEMLPVPLFVDGTLSRLPGELVVRVLDGAVAGSTEPWVWVNTESTAITTPPDLANEGPPDGPGPVRLDALVRAGDPAELKALGFFTRRGVPAPTGVDAEARFTSTPGATTFGVDARALLDLPRHVEIWQPDLASCSRTSPEPAACQTLPRYEMEEWQRMALRIATTAATLGDLTAHVRYRHLAVPEPTPVVDEDDDVEAAVENIPGSLSVGFDLSQNRRLPWTKVSLDFNGSTPLGGIHARVRDRLHPVYRGDGVNRGPENLVPNYRLDLAHVGAKLTVRADVRNAEAPNAGPKTDNRLCPLFGYDGRRGLPDGVGYVNADLDLHDTVTTVDLGMRNAKESPTQADGDQTSLVFAADDVVDGRVRIRLNKVGLQVSESTAADFLGIPLGSSTVKACVDFDLPVDLKITHLRRAMVGSSGAKMAIHIPAADRPAASVDGRIHERYFCKKDCPAPGPPAEVDRAGAPFAYRFVEFNPVGPGHWWEGAGREWHRMGILGTGLWCHGFPCYGLFESEDDVDFGSLTLTTPPLAGYETAEFVVDPFWSPGNRQSMWKRDNKSWIPGRPGGEFYKSIVNNNTTPTKFAPPPGPSAMPVPVGGIDEYLTLGCWGTATSAGKATGADGTRYEISLDDLCVMGWRVGAYAVVTARHPDGSIRWSRAFPFEATFLFKTVTFHVQVKPTAEGAVGVSAWLAFGGKDLLWTREGAYLDPSGFGAWDYTGVVGTRVGSLAAGPTTLYTTLGALPAGWSRVWYVGDGDAVTDKTLSITHAYPAAGTYALVVVDYDAGGSSQRSDRALVTITP